MPVKAPHEGFIATLTAINNHVSAVNNMTEFMGYVGNKKYLIFHPFLFIIFRNTYQVLAITLLQIATLLRPQ